MNGMTREEVKRLLGAELDRLGLTRLAGMFAVEHSVPRGTHKEQAAAGGGDAETLEGHPASDFVQAGQAVTPAAHHTSHEAGGSDVVDADTLDTKHASDFAEAAHTHAGADITSQVGDSDKLDGQDASAFAAASHNHDSTYAPASQGVVNGNSHDHDGGDGAQVPEGGLSLSDVTTGDVSTTKHGFAPKAPNDTSKFLRGDGAWAEPGGGGLGYTLQVRTTMLGPADGATYYLGPLNYWATTYGYGRFKIPKSGTIKALSLNWLATTTAGSNESISCYIRVNDSTDTLIATIGDGLNHKTFENTSLNISVSAGDTISVKIVCPTWATNPAAVYVGGVIYIE
jgi:hypothetical protein